MIQTPLSASRLDELRAEFDVIPVVRRLSADTITPVAAFAAVAREGDEAFLLESVEKGESVGRYSFIGVRPRRRMEFPHGIHSPVDELRRELAPLSVWQIETLPPFFGGAVGWFGYGVARWCERLPDRHAQDGSLDAELLFFNEVIAFDHARQELILVACLFSRDERSSSVLLSEAGSKLDTLEADLSHASMRPLRVQGDAVDLEFQRNVSPETFCAAVEYAREQIAAGEIFQVVLSQQWECEMDESHALTLYRVLRSMNPSPYMFLLRTHECTLVGTSPEMLVRVDAHGQIETRPIAGTRPRSPQPGEDRALEDDLLRDPKERAEHLMLLDLGRNDLGRVARRGSVEITRFASVERYSHVMHLVSDVRASLREDAFAIDAFLSAFPAGTVTGAPRIRAMEIIDEIEPSRRGAYAGAVAYFGFGGTLDSCIAIRTIVLRDGKATIQAGAGVVYDSDAGREYQECLNKSAALRRAVSITARSGRPA